MWERTPWQGQGGGHTCSYSSPNPSNSVYPLLSLHLQFSSHISHSCLTHLSLISHSCLSHLTLTLTIPLTGVRKRLHLHNTARRVTGVIKRLNHHNTAHRGNKSGYLFRKVGPTGHHWPGPVLWCSGPCVYIPYINIPVIIVNLLSWHLPGWDTVSLYYYSYYISHLCCFCFTSTIAPCHAGAATPEEQVKRSKECSQGTI